MFPIIMLKVMGFVLQLYSIFGWKSLNNDTKRTLAGFIILLWAIAGVLDFAFGNIFGGVLSFIIVALFVPQLLIK